MLDDKKVSYGVVDFFSSYKICNYKKCKNFMEKFSKLQCTITDLTFEENIAGLGFKNEFETFMVNQTSKIRDHLKQFDYKSIIKNENSEVAVDQVVNNEVFRPALDIKIEVSKESGITKFRVIDNYIEKLNYNLELLKETHNVTSRHLGKSVSQFKDSYLLQPILIECEGKVVHINVKATIYKCGILIIQYTVPVEDYKFSNFMLIGDKIVFDKAYLPKYIIDNCDKYDYEEVKHEKISSLFSEYENYIIRNTSKTNNYYTYFTNITLINYDDMPSNFNSVSEDIKRKVFWIINYPFQVVNEREKAEYDSFWKNEGHLASKYFRLFCSSNGRSIILANKDLNSVKITKDESVTFNKEEIYKLSNDFIITAIENILIKKVHYNMLNDNTYISQKSLKSIRKKKIEIMDIEDLIFSINNGGFSTVRLAQQYLEGHLVDYLPTNFLANRFKALEDITKIKDESLKARYNSFLAFVAMMFPVVFGLESVEYMVNKIKVVDLLGNNINIENQGIYIWIGLLFLILFQIIFLFKDEILHRIERIYFYLRIVYVGALAIVDFSAKYFKDWSKYKHNKLEDNHNKWSL